MTVGRLQQYEGQTEVVSFGISRVFEKQLLKCFLCSNKSTPAKLKFSKLFTFVLLSYLLRKRWFRNYCSFIFRQLEVFMVQCIGTS
jgi:hypothetical protein